MDKLFSLLISEGFMLVALAILAGLWARAFSLLQRARRTGTIRTAPYGIGSGRTIHRSSDALAFGRSVRRRVVELALLLLAVIWVARMALVSAIGAFI